jgi:hypothetical protein
VTTPDEKPGLDQGIGAGGPEGNGYISHPRRMPPPIIPIKSWAKSFQRARLLRRQRRAKKLLTKTAYSVIRRM